MTFTNVFLVPSLKSNQQAFYSIKHQGPLTNVLILGASSSRASLEERTLRPEQTTYDLSERIRNQDNYFAINQTKLQQLVGTSTKRSSRILCRSRVLLVKGLVRINNSFCRRTVMRALLCSDLCPVPLCPVSVDLRVVVHCKVRHLIGQ